MEGEGSSGNFQILLSVAAPIQSLWERGMPDHVRKRGEENTGPFFMLPFFCMVHLKRRSDFIGRLLPYFSPPCLAILLWVLQINSANILIIK